MSTCCHAAVPVIGPMTVAFFRPVRLLVTPKTFVERVDVEAVPDLSSGNAALTISAHCWNTITMTWTGTAAWRIFDDETGRIVGASAASTVDRFGRRGLMLFGCAGIAVSHTVLGFTYRAGTKGLPILVITLCTIACYALSLAPVTWVLISEIFPTESVGLLFLYPSLRFGPRRLC